MCLFIFYLKHIELYINNKNKLIYIIIINIYINIFKIFFIFGNYIFNLNSELYLNYLIWKDRDFGGYIFIYLLFLMIVLMICDEW